MPTDELVPVHATMMALALKMLSVTQFGAYFSSDEHIQNLHSLYDRVSCHFTIRLNQT